MICVSGEGCESHTLGKAEANRRLPLRHVCGQLAGWPALRRFSAYLPPPRQTWVSRCSGDGRSTEPLFHEKHLSAKPTLRAAEISGEISEGLVRGDGRLLLFAI